MAGGHARLAPSAASRWMRCPGSVNAIEAQEGKLGNLDAPNEYSRRGTAVHELLARAMSEQTAPAAWLNQNLMINEGSGSYVHKIVAEDVAGATVAYDYAQARIQQMAADYQTIRGTSENPDSVYAPQVFVEHKVDPGAVFHQSSVPADQWPENYQDVIEHAPRDDCKGTADLILIGSGVLEVIDYKNGHGVVEPSDPQLALYLLGALKLCEQGEVQRMRATIVQPHAHHPDGAIRTVEYTERTLLQWAVAFHDAAVQSDVPFPNGVLVPGETQCRWCPLKKHALCPALGAKVEEALVGAPEPGNGPLAAPETLQAPSVDLTGAMARDPGDLPMETLLGVLTNRELIRGWIKACEERAVTLLNGQEVTPVHEAFKLVEGRGSFDWVDEETARLRISRCKKTKEHGGGKMRKVDYIEEKMLSVAQARKRIKPLVSPAVWKNIETDLIKRDKGKPTLATIDDPRPALTRRAEEVFEPVTDIEKEEASTPDWMG